MRITRLLSPILIVSLASCAQAPSPALPAPSDAEATLSRLEDQWADAFVRHGAAIPHNGRMGPP